ncbi:MAG: transposase [Pseudobdellovibrionaceae bacterium]
MSQSRFDFLRDYKLSFGGSPLKGKRKSARPLSTKKPLHLILKSSGSSFFNPGNRKLENIFREHAKKHSIKIYALSLNWSHVHLLVKLPNRNNYLAFIRTVTAAVVSFISKLRGENKKGLFDLRPFTRILSWGRDFKNTFAYIEKNNLEAWGLAAKKKRPSVKVNSS